MTRTEVQRTDDFINRWHEQDPFELLESVETCIEKALEESMKRFEDAATSLDKMTSDNAQVSKDVLSFIKWCRYFITGVLQWSLESKRYGMADCLHEDGSLSIML